MSIESWNSEFYPVPADQVSKEDALDHSSLKWEGLRPENLERHEVSLLDDRIVDADSSGIRIDSSSCALCFHFDSEEYCPGCPIYESRGRRCDWRLRGEVLHPWGYFSKFNNPLPMIEALRKAKEFVQIQAAKPKAEVSE